MVNGHVYLVKMVQVQHHHGHVDQVRMVKVQYHHQHHHGRHQRVGMIRGVGPRGINSAYLLGGHLDLSTTCHRADADAIKYTSWGSFISHQLREFQCQRCFREAMIKMGMRFPEMFYGF